MKSNRLLENKQQSTKTYLTKLPNVTQIIVILLSFVCSFIVFTDNIAYDAKVSMIVFIITLALWVCTKLPAAYVALGALLLLILLNGANTDVLYSSLSSEIIWLMIGAFIIGEAFSSSGLSLRMTRVIIHKAKNTNQLLLYLMLSLFPLAIFIPSTSGRAVLMLPIVREIANLVKNKQQREIIALFVPVIILMTTSSTLLGAGSHLIGIEILEKTTGDSISYINWLIWGLPFALIISFITYFVFKLFFSKELTAAPFDANNINNIYEVKPVSKKEKQTLILLTVLILLWLTEALHGYEIGLITIVGAFIFMLPKYGVITWKKGLQAVSWNLILFVAAATALGKNLVETGAVSWIEQEVFKLIGAFPPIPAWGLVSLIILIAITSHIYITSHTTRAVVMVPGILMLSMTLNLEPSSMLFLSLVGMNYCLTFPVSSKALLVYYEHDTMSYRANILLKLNMFLMPIYFILMILFYFTYWNWTGL
ncbi:SLC13 family permease [Cytobacillus sp. FSL W7-1323]|uniref:SLC13 family permease n=1 Tax=Cytobacillus TaxID=2675230 RepID=UPI002E1F7FD5|nr:SLC13 family permease [Cytobacillus kochii]MED1605042.1 SLC13 family permease [Cytobacillus kochii]